MAHAACRDLVAILPFSEGRRSADEPPVRWHCQHTGLPPNAASARCAAQGSNPAPSVGLPAQDVPLIPGPLSLGAFSCGHLH